MAEEAKEKGSTSNVTLAVSKFVLGLVLVSLGILAIIAWRSSLVTVLKGCVGLFLVLVGLISMAIAKE